ncbi:MAG: 2-dehydro-3-deoxygalactonokinase [Pseudomonadota bacterium]
MIIAVDWGTSRLRAYLIGGDGEMLGRIEADKGLMRVEAGNYEVTLAAAIEPLRTKAPDAPVIMAGMVGARQGWVEAPYVALPARKEDLAAAIMAVHAPSVGKVAIIPGVSSGSGREGWADVMRGEETEIIGALATLDILEGTFVMPGTHSKWVNVKDGAIVSFRTYLTGEAYQALSRHTILSKTLGEGGDEEGQAFLRGVDEGAALSGAGDLLARLFSIRAETLFGRLGPEETGPFLSGLLVGAEVAAAASSAKEVFVVGAKANVRRYEIALGRAGIAVAASPPDAAARGVALMADHAASLGLFAD